MPYVGVCWAYTGCQAKRFKLEKVLSGCFQALRGVAGLYEGLVSLYQILRCYTFMQA